MRQYCRVIPHRTNSFQKETYKLFCIVFLSWLFTFLFSILLSYISINCVLVQTEFSPYKEMTEKMFGEHKTFYDYEIITHLNKKDFSQCKFCNFPKDNHSTSTSKDLALAVLFGHAIFNVVNWVRTLRSTGCKCQILFFHEKDYTSYFNKEELEMLNNCGVVWWSLDTGFHESKLVNDPRTTKFLVIQNFLEAYGFLFSRVMISDVFDTIFQHDPFIDALPQDKISVSIERMTFIHHPWNMDWVRNADPNWSMDFWQNKYVINGGFQIGKPELIVSLFKAMNQPKYFFGHTKDQGPLNTLYYRNLWTDMWIDFRGEHFVSACRSIFQDNPDKNGFMHESYNPNNEIAVIHQFDRVCPIAENLVKICPVMGSWHRFPSGRLDHFRQKCNN